MPFVFRFQEEKTKLEQGLAQKYEMCLVELNKKHQTELEHERVALVNKHEEEITTLHVKHNAQLESLSASHRAELAAMVVKLESKHNTELVAVEAALGSKRKADLESLEAVFQKTNQAQLEAFEAELAYKHQEEKDEIEKRMLANMDTVEATYLKEVQVRFLTFNFFHILSVFAFCKISHSYCRCYFNFRHCGMKW